jgi:DNA-binding transcriptional ArsR family regulator
VSIQDEWIVLDTNIWIFGQRRVLGFSECAELLDFLSRLRVVLPRQILQELQANFSESEMSSLFRLLNRLPSPPKIDWQKPAQETVAKYRNLGCKLGDAAVSAHLEELGINVLVTENRDFLEELSGLPFSRLKAREVLAELRALNPR